MCGGNLARPNSPRDIFYWLTTLVAALMLIFAVADLFISWAQGTPIVRVFALVAAAGVWLIGRAVRALLR